MITATTVGTFISFVDRLKARIQNELESAPDGLTLNEIVRNNTADHYFYMQALDSLKRDKKIFRSYEERGGGRYEGPLMIYRLFRVDDNMRTVEKLMRERGVGETAEIDDIKAQTTLTEYQVKGALERLIAFDQIDTKTENGRKVYFYTGSNNI